MAALTPDLFFDTAICIQLRQERALSVTFSSAGISIRFPTTRRLAEYLGVPHYYVLPVFGQMEEEGLITRAERVGITTTPTGTRKFVEMVGAKYRSEAIVILGEPIFQEIERKVRGMQGPQPPGGKL